MPGVVLMRWNKSAANLTQQATAQAATYAGLTERLSQAQQRAERLDDEAQEATREADQPCAQLPSAWDASLNDRTAP